MNAAARTPSLPARFLALLGLLHFVPAELAALDLEAHLTAVSGTDSVEIVLGLEDLFSPALVEQSLVDRPDLAASVGATLADALARAEPQLADRLAAYGAAIARERSWRLSDRREEWPDEEIAGLVSLQLVDFSRFGRDPHFRARVVSRLADGLDPKASPALRSRVLGALAAMPGVDFATFEVIAFAWKAIARTSTGRWVPDSRPPPVLDGAEIDASMFVLPSTYFTADEVLALVAAVHDIAPDRNLIVLTDGPVLRRLAPLARTLNVELIDTFGSPFSPWPRDPLTLAAGPTGGVHVLMRPNAQPRRELDALVGLNLIAGLSESLDRLWGPLTWDTSRVPFHNGQVLLTRERAWISIHTQEERILEIQGLRRVPAARFHEPDTLARYLEATRRAADELEELYGRPVRFVHPLPVAGPEAGNLMRGLGGGAGYDLDSLLTLLPEPGGDLFALVADLQAGKEILAGATDEDLAALAELYGLKGSEDALRRSLEQAQETARAAALQEFLDLVALDLAAEARVLRLPILQVPMALRRDPASSEVDFLLTWNNVVTDETPDERLAEGFAARFPPGDRAAEAVFAQAGYRLRLLPPMVQSVLRNGGYRCASQHLRLRRGS